MLVALLPTQVPDFWEVIRPDLEENMPPISDYGPYDMNNILYGLMTGMMVCWIYTDREQRMQGFLITTVLKDLSGVKSLLLYSIVLYTKESVDWRHEFETIKKHARSMGCAKIAAFILNKEVLKVLEENNVETRFVFANVNI